MLYLKILLGRDCKVSEGKLFFSRKMWFASLEEIPWPCMFLPVQKLSHVAFFISHPCFCSQIQSKEKTRSCLHTLSSM